jgi:replicative DNA helicase
MLGGVRPGEVVTIAGRPGMGSSALALRMILEIAASGLPVLIVSVSHPATHYSRRLLATIGSLDAHQIFSGAITDDDWPRLTHAIQTLDGMSVVIDDSPEANTMHIAKACETTRTRFGALPALFIDDAHLITCTDLPGEETFGRFAKRLARQFDTIVILTSSLLRSVDERINKRPVLPDLLAPSGLAEMSDAVLFTYDDAHYNCESPDRGTVEVFIARNNGGPIGAVRLTKWRGIVGNFGQVEASRPQGTAPGPFADDSDSSL